MATVSTNTSQDKTMPITGGARIPRALEELKKTLREIAVMREEAKK